MEVQPQLILLQKTLLNIEGLGRQLYPDLDLWQDGEALSSKRWMKEQLGSQGAGEGAQVPMRRSWGETLPALPGLAHEVLRQARSGQAAGGDEQSARAGKVCAAI